MALLLRRKGIRKVRPLAGGVEAWRRLTPLESTHVTVAAPDPGPRYLPSTSPRARTRRLWLEEIRLSK